MVDLQQVFDPILIWVCVSVWIRKRKKRKLQSGANSQKNKKRSGWFFGFSMVDENKQKKCI